MSDERPIVPPIDLIPGSETAPDQPATAAPPETEPLEAAAAPSSAPTPNAAPGVADGQDHPVSRSKIAVDRISGAITTSIIGLGSFIGVLVVILSTDMARPYKMAVLLGWAVLSGLLAAYTLIWPAIAWRYRSYRVSTQGFRLREGVLWRSVISVPRNRVQHTDVSQGPIERQFDLATLIVHTAGTEHASVSLDGLPHATALAIRDHLIGSDDDDAV